MRATDIVRRRERTQRNRRGSGLLRAAAVAGLVAGLAVIVFAAAATVIVSAGSLAVLRDLPDVRYLERLPAAFRPTNATTRVFAWSEPDQGGLRRPVLIDEIGDPRLGGSAWIRYGDLPTSVVNAHLAAVDQQFMDHRPSGPLRIVAGWWQTGTLGPGPSPITRRMIDTMLRGEPGSSHGEWQLALQDRLLDYQIGQRYTRAQILEWELNTRYYGNLAFGVEAASRVYFGKGASELTPAEAILLAAIAVEPQDNPFDSAEAALSNRTAVLDAMSAMGAIAPDDAAAIREAPLALAPPPGSESPTPEFSRLVRNELEAILGPEQLVLGGWQVETTLDLALQTQVGCVAAAYAGQLSGRSLNPAGSGPPCPARDLLPPVGAAITGEVAPTVSIVALNPATGAIEALVGEAATRPAPIGSLVRPLIHLTALSRGHTAASLVWDVPGADSEEDPHTLQNADGRFLGPLRLREAMASGRAVPAAQILNWVGVERVLVTARALGLPVERMEVPSDLSFFEQGVPATLLELGHAYSALANEGALTGAANVAGSPRPATVTRILGPAGEEVYALEAAAQGAIDRGLAFLAADILSDAGARCPANDCPDLLPILDERPVAMVGGESAAGDSWTLGFTADRLIGVRVRGNSDGEPVDSAPPWAALMAWSSAGRPAAGWTPPGGLRRIDVCEVSGLLPSREAGCRTISEWFAPGTEPASTDTMVRELAVNRETGRLATIFTPPQLVERRTYIDYPPEASAWAEEAGIEAPPAEYDTIRNIPVRSGGAAVLLPDPWSVVGGQVSVIGSAGGDDFAYFRLAYFPGLLPEAMQTLVERGESPVESGELGVWDTTLLEDGLYTLLLSVVRGDGKFDEVAIPVSVANE